jgi:hypothetical protein
MSTAANHTTRGYRFLAPAQASMSEHTGRIAGEVAVPPGGK